MKAKCWNPEVIRRYKESYRKVNKKAKDGEIDLDEHEGELYSNYKGRLYMYETASGKGIWYIEAPRGAEPINCLVFEGKRHSFRNGSGFLGWQPRLNEGWTVVESSHKDRGAFETRKQYYRRNANKWLHKGTPKHIRIYRMPTSLLRKHWYSKKLEKSLIELDTFDSEIPEARDVFFDSRDIDEKKFLKELDELAEREWHIVKCIRL